MSYWDQIIIGALGNLVGGALVTLIFFLVQMCNEKKRAAIFTKTCHAVIQAELKRHSNCARAFFQASQEDLAELPTFDTSALRIIPLLGHVQIDGAIDRFIKLNTYVDKLENLNSRIIALRSFLVGPGATITFGDDEVNQRDRLIGEIKVELRAIDELALRLMGEFPTDSSQCGRQSREGNSLTAMPKFG